MLNTLVGVNLRDRRENACQVITGLLTQGDSGSRGIPVPSQEPLSRSGITTRANIPNDVMTFWVRRGLVRPIEAPSGMGRHLRFEWYEANIAAIMNQLRMVGVSIDAMLSITTKFRQGIAWATELGVTRDDVFAMITYRNLRTGLDERDYSVEYFNQELESWSNARHGNQRLTDRIIAIADRADKSDFRKYEYAYTAITDQPDRLYQPDATYFWRVGDDWRFDFNETGLAAAREDGALASIAVDIPSTLFHVWNRP